MPTENILPKIGGILKRMRILQKLSLREVADKCDLSPSFLSAIERGDSDISIGRLTRLAEAFGHDIGSLLGYTTGFSRPRFVTGPDRVLINRGAGVRYEILRLPAMGFEIDLMTLEPRSAFRDKLAHEGIDVILCTSGKLVMEVEDLDYSLRENECVIYSGRYAHRLRNESGRIASAIGITTGRM